jgi:hypothetical protein
MTVPLIEATKYVKNMQRKIKESDYIEMKKIVE